LPDDVASVRQCNEGDFEFLLTEDAGEDGDAVELEIKVGKFVDSSLMDVDVQPRVARALVKGRMLCLTLPVEVLPDASTAQRSKVTGSLVVHMPKARTREKDSKTRGSDYFVGTRRPAGGPRGAVSAANPGWAASGTGSEDLDARRRRVTQRAGGGSSPIGRDLVRDLGGVSLSRGAVTDTDRAVGGAIDMRERVAPPSGPAAAAKQHAVYGDDSDDEPPPL
jgi:protein TilB